MIDLMSNNISLNPLTANISLYRKKIRYYENKIIFIMMFYKKLHIDKLSLINDFCNVRFSMQKIKIIARNLIKSL